MKILANSFTYLKPVSLNSTQSPIKPFSKLARDKFERSSPLPFKGKFQPAQSVEEGIQYGKNNFGIRKYWGFDDNELDLLNWLNEGLFNLKNIMKEGAFVPPIKVKSTFGLDDDSEIEMADGELWLNKVLFRKDSEFINGFVEKSEWYNFNSIAEAQKFQMKNNNSAVVLESPYSLIYHEMGHIQHRNNIGADLFKQISKSPKRNLSKTAQELINLFNKNKKTIASRVSDYATENLMEFVAETFAGLCEGIKYDNKVMDLYRKLGGVEI